ncbi:MAG: YihY family inner membrane protein [Syntrophorhabdaceae bacterium]|nr:YihY family inner membrane protein [Syntrophorhabdaceae bacterium]
MSRGAKVIDNVKRWGGNFLIIAKESFLSFRRNNDFEGAASLAYYGFFASIPLFFIVISFLSFSVISLETAVKGIEGITSRIFPHFGKTISDEVNNLAKHKGAIGILGFVLLFWSITPLTSAVRNKFIQIFQVDRTVSFIKGTFLDIVAVSAILMLFASLLLTELFYHYYIPFFSPSSSSFYPVIDFIVSFVAIVLFIVFFYIIFSPIRLRPKELFVSSTITSLSWIGIKELFSALIVYNPEYGIAFGSLKAIFIIILWSYFSFAVLLLGAEIMAGIRKMDAILLKELFNSKKGLTDKRWRMMGRFIRVYDEGYTLFKEGEMGDMMYYIKKGSVVVSRHGKVVNVLKAGEYFGEMSMLTGAVRVATARVGEPNTELIPITKENFEQILSENPKMLMRIFKEMASRLKFMDENFCSAEGSKTVDDG